MSRTFEEVFPQPFNTEAEYGYNGDALFYFTEDGATCCWCGKSGCHFVSACFGQPFCSPDCHDKMMKSWKEAEQQIQDYKDGNCEI